MSLPACDEFTLAVPGTEGTSGCSLVSRNRGSATIKPDRSILTFERREDMRHPAHVWTDPSYAKEPLGRLRTEYVEHLRGRARQTSPATVEKYRNTLVNFERSLERHGDPVILESLTPHAVNRWINEQRSKGQAEDGISSRLSALKVFSKRYIFEHLELTTVDLLRKVPRITPPERSMPALTVAEQEKLLEVFERGTYEDVRNRAMIAVYMATGLRLSELLNVDMASFDRVSGEMAVVGKGNRERLVRLSPRAMREVRTYLKRRPEGGSERLFLTEDGRPLTFWGVQSVFRRLKERSGLHHVHAHLLRHNFAKKALQNGADRGVVQDMLGHASPVMTNRYLGDERKAQAAREMVRYSPI